MSTLLLILYSGVTAMILAALAGAVRSVASRPFWAVASASPAQSVGLQMVETVDRRTQQLPFVGQDRRQARLAVAEERKAAQAGG